MRHVVFRPQSQALNVYQIGTPILHTQNSTTLNPLTSNSSLFPLPSLEPFPHSIPLHCNISIYKLFSQRYKCIKTTPVVHSIKKYACFSRIHNEYTCNTFITHSENNILKKEAANCIDITKRREKSHTNTSKIGDPISFRYASLFEKQSTESAAI